MLPVAQLMSALLALRILFFLDYGAVLGLQLQA
jgi:hypothetical protein